MGSAYWGKFSELGSNGVQFPCLKREQPPTMTEWARGAVTLGEEGRVLGEVGREGSHPP